MSRGRGPVCPVHDTQWEFCRDCQAHICNDCGEIGRCSDCREVIDRLDDEYLSEFERDADDAAVGLEP